jgi:hypothetical protein
MPRPTSKNELLDAMSQQYTALLSAIDEVELPDRLLPGACDAWSIKDVLGHLDAWHEMFLIWEQAGAAGERIAMPAPGYTWKETPELNEEIYQRIKDDPYDEIVARLDDSHRRVRGIIAGYPDDDLVTKRRFGWTGSTSVLSYAVSATSSHYDWARELILKYKKTL